jgi:hypothetical protein
VFEARLARSVFGVGGASLPLLVALTLGVSTGAAARVGIVCNDRPRTVVRTAPRRCTVLPPRASFSEGVNLAGIRWRSWGGISATGTGFELGFHLPFSREPVAIVAYRIRRCPSGLSVYTRVRVSSRYGTTAARAQECL